MYITYRTFQPLYSGQSPRQISGLDDKTTFTDLVERICKKEDRPAGVTAKLFLPNGIPLNCNHATIQWTLKDWHIRHGDLLLVIFCREEYSKEDFIPPDKELPLIDPENGHDKVNINGIKCCSVKINNDDDNGHILYEKVSKATHIPIMWMQLFKSRDDLEDEDKGDGIVMIEDSEEEDLSKYKLKGADITVHFCPNYENKQWKGLFASKSYNPLHKQSDKGMAAFNSLLLVIAHHVSADEIDLRVLQYVMHITACPPLVLSLARLFDKRMPSTAQKVAIYEGLYEIFKALKPGHLGNKIFEESLPCWKHIFSQAERPLESYFSTTIALSCAKCGCRLYNPHKDEQNRIICYSCTVRKGYINQKMKKDVQLQVSQLLVALPCEDEASYWDLIEDVTDWPPANEPHCGTVDEAKIPQYLKIREPNQLRFKPEENVPPLVMQDDSDNYVVFTGRCSDKQGSGKTHYLFNPLEGEETVNDINVIAGKRQITKVGNRYKTEPYITERPDEAIMVILDYSYSMSCDVFSDMSRLDVAKLLFLTFADRCITYNLKNAVGIIVFCDRVDPLCCLTEAMEGFIPIVTKELGQLEPMGATAMWDAVKLAWQHLKEVQKRFPKDCITRILCLTDGGDNSSETNADECVRLLKRTDTKLDCILIGYDSHELQQAAIATGGCAFSFDNIADAIKMSEMEAVLSYRFRSLNGIKPAAIMSSNLHQKMFQPFTEPPDLAHHVTLPIIHLQNNVEKPANLNLTSEERTKRILQELVDLTRKPIDDIQVYPLQMRFDFWRVVIFGSEESIHGEAAFLLFIRFPNNYPIAPPEIRFQTPVYHWSITEEGRICLHLLQPNSFSKSTSMRQILTSIYNLVMKGLPSPRDEQNSVLDPQKSALFEMNVDEFKVQARQSAMSPAVKKAYTQLMTQLASTDIDDEIPAKDEAWYLQD